MIRVLDLVYERLQVTSSDEVCLRLYHASCLGGICYVAWSESRHTYVDRELAIVLRSDGARWCDDIGHDPCAVA